MRLLCHALHLFNGLCLPCTTKSNCQDLSVMLQATDAYIRSRAHSTVSSHSNPLFSAGPEETFAQRDTKPYSNPKDGESVESRASSAELNGQ